MYGILLPLLSVVILSVYIIFPEKVSHFYFKRCRKLCQGLFFHFAKIIIFSENLSFFYCFFSLFFASTFVTFAPTFVAFASSFAAFALTFVAFASTTKFAWEHHQKIQNPYRKSIHIMDFSVTKGSPFYAICDVLVNTCEGRVHALNPLCL